MNSDGQREDTSRDGQVLHWHGRVLSADDLRRSLNGRRELILAPGTLITPLAADHLRANGVRFSRQEKQTGAKENGAVWGYAEERPYEVVAGVLRSAERDGLRLKRLQASGNEASAWARALAECLARGDCRGGVVFCADPGLVCCVANKVKGLRAVAVANVVQTGRALSTLAANLLAVEMPGRTFFEIRQIVRGLTVTTACPPAVEGVLRELENHAHC
jgi:hypothetical protein